MGTKLALMAIAAAALLAGCSGNGAAGSSSGAGSGSGSSGTSTATGSTSSGSGGSSTSTGGSTGSTGGTGTVDAGPATLMTTVRDFKFYDASDPMTDPDFENPPSNQGADDRGIVKAALGADGKPVYAHGDGGTITTHGQAPFDAWYHDAPGINIARQVPLHLSALDGGTYQYDSNLDGVLYDPSHPSQGRGYFPIDDGTPYATTFGDQGKAHNYSFTTELHTTFVYHPGDSFSFRGDDDVFVFINHQLAIDVGGIHDPESQTVDFGPLHLTPGQTYPLDFFSAERHMTGSNIEFQTTLELQPVFQ